MNGQASSTQTIDTRSVDDLGRVVIPKPLRVKYDISEGDEVAFSDNGETIVLQKSRDCCCVCRSLEDIVFLDSLGRQGICQICLEKIKA
jgi:AbrB family looped-hinge helix DNA binding protein